MEFFQYLCLGALVNLPSCVLVPWLLVRSGFLDVPGARSSHACPTPKGGGVGIVLAFLLAAIMSGTSAALWAPICALALLNFLNDLNGISPLKRLTAQFLSASLVLGWALWSGAVTWSLWLLLGIAPVGLDGFSQLFSQIGLPFINEIIPYRESTPFLRVLTGALFGFMTAWFGLPYVEESMQETRQQLVKKERIIEQTSSK